MSHVDTKPIDMKKRIRSLLFFGITALILVVAGYYFYTRVVAPPPKMNATAPATNSGGAGGRSLPVSIYIAGYYDISDGNSAVGILLANETVDLACQTSGKVVLINFEEGQRVERGDLLVKIDDLDLQAQLTRAEHQFSLAAEKLERQRILFEKDAVSREAFDQAQTDYNLIEADIELLKVRIDRTEIKAPFSGIIGFRSISLGAYLQAGAKVATLTDISTLKLEFSVSEKNVFQRLEGSTAIFSVTGSEREYSAKVYAIDPVLEEKTKTVGLRALYDNREGLLRPNMSA
ncbi:MAG: efflux RND transporter periplasmic adaptor subunit, partial [Bacteroidetes bacterium]|nr:efflux RND transporter periplasmic adaptor subunit [Bacteroidota bacterium]